MHRLVAVDGALMEIEEVKKLLLAAMMMIAAAPLAFAAGPTASLSVQIVPVPAGPQPPPAAQAAGYTTLAFHSDFSQPFYATLSNWLDCAGAANPQWFATGAFGRGAPPCARYSIVNDGGTPVLDMVFTAADAGSGGTALITTNDHGNPFTQGVDFPNGAYWQATFRNNPAAQDGSAVPFGTHIGAWWTWSDTGQTANSSAFIERDFLESYATGCCHNDTGMVPWNAPSGQGVVVVAGFGLPEYQIDNTVYHTIGARVTQDAGGANMAICSYVDGVFQSCQDTASHGWTGAAALTSSELNARNYPILFVGSQNTSPPVTADMHMLVKDVQIWTCAGWQGPLNQQGHPCNGPVLTSAP